MTASPTPEWNVNCTDHHAWAKEFQRRGLGPELLDVWFANAMQAARDGARREAAEAQSVITAAGGSVLPMVLDDGTAIVCSQIAGGARYTGGLPDDLVVTIAKPGQEPTSARFVQVAIVDDHQKMIRGYRLAHARLVEAREVGALTEGSWLDSIACALTGESMAPDEPAGEPASGAGESAAR